MGMLSLVHRGMWNCLVGSFHPIWIILGAWVIGGAVLMICEGDAIGNSLLLIAGIILIIWFESAVASKFDNFMNLFICGYYFSGEERTSQGLIFLDGLLSLDL